MAVDHGDSALIVQASTWRRSLLQRVVRGLFTLAAEIEVSGAGNIPNNSSCLLVFNHLSNFDPPLFLAVIDRPNVTALLAGDYRKRRFHRFCLDAAGVVWIERGTSDRAALRQALAHLDQGWIVGIAPEGTRSRDHVLHPGKPGAAFLATHANALILPVGITGTESLASDLKRLRRGRITVRFGEPFRAPAPSAGRSKQYLQSVTDNLMHHIADLIPPAHRGVYGDQPGRTLAGATIGGNDDPTRQD